MLIHALKKYHTVNVLHLEVLKNGSRECFVWDSSSQSDEVLECHSLVFCQVFVVTRERLVLEISRIFKGTHSVKAIRQE